MSVHKKAWMNEEGMFYLRTVCSEKKLFMRATNTILGIFETRCFREAYTGLPVVHATENQKALNCVVLKYSIPVSEE